MNDLDELAAAAHKPVVPYAGAMYPACPVCGYRGKPVKEEKGSWPAALLLLALAVAVGYFSPVLGVILFVGMLLYVLLNLGHVYKCGACGAKRADA